MSDDIATLNNSAAELVLSIPQSTRIRVISHYDADGISAAGIVCTALLREGYDFHATLMRNPFNKGLERLAQENNELLIFSDMGSAQIDAIQKIGCKAIIIDHHQYLVKKSPKNVLQINANLCGIDGNYEACGATLSFSFAQALNKRNNDLASLALSGAIGDKQHIGGLRGFNKKILDQAVQNGDLNERVGMKFSGESIFDALYYSIDPYYVGLSGNDTEIEQVLGKLTIERETELKDITSDKMKKLQSYLVYKLIQKGCQPNIIDIAIRKRYFSKSLDCELERFADLLDACGKFGHRGVGLSLCLGDTASFTEAEAIEKKYKQKILTSLLDLEKGKVSETKGLRYFTSESSSLGGVVAGIAVNYIFDEQKPLFSLARKKDEIHVSCRGNRNLVEKGLDLGGAMKKVSSEIGGYGGGHKIAAGATIALDKEKEFLDKVDSILVNQMK